MRHDTTRHALIARLRHRLRREGWPRLQMLLLVMLTAGAGFLASGPLHLAGWRHPTQRYPAAVAIAYLVFLALLWLWLETSAADWAEGVSNLGDALPDDGRSGAGGACEPSDGASAEEGEALPGLDALEAADEFAIALALLLLLLAVLVGAVWLVYAAPTLFAELLLDAALAAGLLRRLRGAGDGNWLLTALRRSAPVFLVAALMLGVTGWGLEHAVPGAETLGQALAARRS